MPSGGAGMLAPGRLVVVAVKLLLLVVVLLLLLLVVVVLVEAVVLLLLLLLALPPAPDNKQNLVNLSHESNEYEVLYVSYVLIENKTRHQENI